MRNANQIAAMLFVLLMLPGAASAGTVLHPTVAELFTSQACSSCPPADSLMKQMAGARPDLLVLSYHVSYWDHLGWKDPFSLLASSERQRGYRTALKDPVLYTPELVVNGAISMIGSDENKVSAALTVQRIDMAPFNIEIFPQGKRGHLQAIVNANGSSPVPAQTQAWEIVYTPYARTRIGGGENEGRTVETINNVRAIKSLGIVQTGSGPYDLQNPPSPGDRIAVIIQAIDQGPILAAASYQP